jgi:hypothetical protein
VSIAVPVSTSKERPGGGWLVLLAPALLLAAVHAQRIGGWLIDDAGITFAYARNLAYGYGLVSQPGAAPLEGFSNPLWTFVLAPFFALGAFDPLWTPKLLAFALLAGTIALLLWNLRGPGVGPWLAGSAALLLALDTSFMVWSMSGLENALLAFLLAVSASLALRSGGAQGRRWDGVAGIVAGLLALTRPDAVLYAAAYPAALLIGRQETVRAWLRYRLVPYAIGLVAVFGSYLVFRRAYFGDWVPNTFHAKVRPWMMAVDAGRALELVQSAVGRLTWPVLALIGLALAASLRRRSPAPRLAVLAVYLVLAAGAYVILPPDWMGEYRFATGFFLFFYWALGEALAWWWAAGRPLRVRWLAPAAVVLLLAESVSVHAARTDDFARNPTVPFGRISEFARAYDRLASALGPGTHSLLTPDLGGMLYTTRLRVYDLAGLCDRTIARTLMDDATAFHDYVFAATRPTFIHIHGTWSDWARLHADARFARDYAVLYETWARPSGADAGGEGEPWSGDYVRREAMATPADIERLQGVFQSLGLDRPLP